MSILAVFCLISCFFLRHCIQWVHYLSTSALVHSTIWSLVPVENG